MYSFIKAAIQFIIPKEFLFKNELIFRHFHGIFYIGNKHQCNICSKKLRNFILLKNGDLLCPFCGSLSRNRRLWSLLTNKIKGKVLHFSPSRSLYRKLKINKAIDYYSSDFENEFLAEYKFDITNINQPDAKFDTIICYHVLEHVIEDKKAILELYRILKSNGIIYVQTPYKEGEIHEDFSITSKEKRKEHFGQEDHVRIYSIKGLKERLKGAGFNVKASTFVEDKNDFYFGFKSPETILTLTK